MQVRKDPYMYDSWFDYLKLEESQATNPNPNPSPPTQP